MSRRRGVTFRRRTTSPGALTTHLARESNFPVPDDACVAATGEPFADWFKVIEDAGLADKRRDAIRLVDNETGRGKDVWWPTEEAFGAWVTGWRGAITDGAPFRCGDATGTVGRIRPTYSIRTVWSSPGLPPTEIEIQFVVVGGRTTSNIYQTRIATRAGADGLRRAWGAALDRWKARVG